MHDTKLKIWRDPSGNSGVDTAKARSESELRALGREFKLHVPTALNDIVTGAKTNDAFGGALGGDPERQALDNKEMLERELAGGLTRKSLHLGVVGTKAMVVEIERTKFGSYRMAVPAGAAGNDREIVAAISKQGHVAAATVGGSDTFKLDRVRDVVAQVVERSLSLFRDKDLAGT